MGRRGRPPKNSKEELTIKSKETLVFLGFIFLAIGISLFFSNSLTGTLPKTLLSNFGQTIYILGTIFTVIGLRMIGVESFFTSSRFLSGLILFIIVTMPFLTYFVPREELIFVPYRGEAGGSIGVALHLFLLGTFGKTAEFGLLATMLLLSISLLSGIPIGKFGDIFKFTIKLILALSSKAYRLIQNVLFKPRINTHQDSISRTDLGLDGKPKIINTSDLEVTDITEPRALSKDKLITNVEEINLDDIGVTENATNPINADIPQQESMEMTFGLDLQGKGRTVTVGADYNKPLNNELSELDRKFSQQYKKLFDTWRYPPLDLLDKAQKDPFSEKELREKTSLIESKLESFKIQAKVVEISVGPSIVQYALNLSPGTKVSKVKSLSKDISLALAASSDSIRIDTIGGTSFIGIEVPRQSPHMVKIREIIASPEMSRDSKTLPLAIGKDIRGDSIVLDLRDMPHLLVAGATGTGKSVCINSILIGFLMKFTPDELRLMLVDPKMVELAIYNDLPYLLSPVITDMDKVLNALDWAIGEMQLRYKLFKEKQVRNLKEFNEANDYKIPHIIIVIDEMADLILTKKEAEQKIIRLAQLARATGIHLILATQRPSVNVITGLIKANIPARIALGVASGIDSRVVIDQLGAESLIGKGDMLIKSPDMPKLKRVQGAYVGTKEIQAVTTFIKKEVARKYGEDATFYIQNILEPETTTPVESNIMGITGNEDPLLNDAIKLVMQQGKGSASSIQRYLKVGFNRAARLLDIMTEKGIVSHQQGSKPREVIISSLDEIEK